MKNSLLGRKEMLLQVSFLMMLFLYCATAQAQNNVTGTVSDEFGPLPGVTVMIDGTSEGTATDPNGRYTLSNVPVDATLVFSYVGYLIQRVPVNGQSTINITMTEDAQSLEEIVVVGYSTQSRTTITGSVSTLDAKEIESLPVPNVSQTLAGRVAGVSMRPNGGAPGGDNPDLHIRGIVTTGNNAPLIVVDGIRRDNINQIDPSSIESVTILKDAAAI